VNLLAPWGFYGWGNIGDEATLVGFARLVARCRPAPRVWVASQNLRHTRRVEPAFAYFPAAGRSWKRWWAQKVASAVVVAGGTPIMDCLGEWPLCDVAPLVTEASRRGLPVSFIGIGTERLARESSRRILGEVLGPLVRQWTVRSRRDWERLVEWGVPSQRVQVAADMAWLLEPVSPDWGRQRLVQWGVDSRRLLAVNLLGEKHVLAREPRLFEKLAEFLDAAVEDQQALVLFLANEVREGDTFDKAAALKTVAAMRHQDRTFIAPNDYLSPQQMCSLLANCRAAVSMRYHFCLFSALAHVPFIAVQRSDKVSDLCFDLDWPFGEALPSLSAASLGAHLARIESQGPHWAAHLEKHVATLRQRAGANRVALDALLQKPLAQSA
jgi:polysaccharide pyruvyl transferase WcaK-like protein